MTFKPGQSYAVLTTGLLRRQHRVLPAGSVTSVDGKHLPLLPHPEAPVTDSQSFDQMRNAFERAYTVATSSAASARRPRRRRRSSRR